MELRKAHTAVSCLNVCFTEGMSIILLLFLPIMFWKKIPGGNDNWFGYQEWDVALNFP